MIQVLVPSLLLFQFGIVIFAKDFDHPLATSKCECGRADPEKNQEEIGRSGRIINGDYIHSRYHPWMALILVKTLEHDELLCGGSLLTKRHVLSARHCFDYGLTDFGDIYLGIDSTHRVGLDDVPLASFEQKIHFDMHDVIKYPSDRVPGFGDVDIALIKLRVRRFRLALNF